MRKKKKRNSFRIQVLVDTDPSLEIEIPTNPTGSVAILEPEDPTIGKFYVVTRRTVAQC